MFELEVVNAFQALALDERRYAFPPAVWRPTGNRTQAHQLQQCWFPGIHGNIGGPDDKAMPLEDIGDITFAWMVCSLRPQVMIFVGSSLIVSRAGRQRLRCADF